MYSIWDKTVKRPEFPALSGDIKTDVVIIGGGITGVLCAHFLKQAGVDCVLVEADRICAGITADTTAKITWQHGLIYSRLCRTVGLEAAALYLDANRAALDSYCELCRDIDCDLEKRDSYVFSRTDIKRLERELNALSRLGVEAQLVRELTLPVSAVGAVRVSGQAQMHPLKLAFSLARGLHIYENTKVTELAQGLAKTNHGNITADSIIVATHFPFINKHGMYFLKLYQHRSYVFAFKTTGKVNGMYVDDAESGLSLRDYGDTLLLGGGGHRTGAQGGGWHELEHVAHRSFSDVAPVARYATQDCMTLDGMPYIGRYSKSTDGMYVATGFNKWGMTGAMVSAKMLCDMLCGKKSPYQDLFDPSRSMLAPQLLKNAAHSVLGLITPTAPRCPHMGCALKYNPQEHSWDCPCHGSRFTVGGELINNPATDDLNFTE